MWFYFNNKMCRTVIIFIYHYRHKIKLSETDILPKNWTYHLYLAMTLISQAQDVWHIRWLMWFPGWLQWNKRSRAPKKNICYLEHGIRKSTLATPWNARSHDCTWSGGIMWHSCTSRHRCLLELSLTAPCNDSTLSSTCIERCSKMDCGY